MNYRKFIIKIVTFLGGIYFFLEFVLPKEIAGVNFSKYHDEISTGAMAIGVMALGLGLINLLSVHGSKLLFKKKGWVYSGMLLLGLFSMTAVMSFDWAATVKVSNKVDQVFMLRDFSQAILADRDNKEKKVPQETVRVEALKGAVKELVGNVENELSFESGDEKNDALSLDIRDSLIELRLLINENRAKEERVDEGWYKEMITTLTKLASDYSDLLNAAYLKSNAKKTYTIFYDGLFVPLGAAMFSLLGFYIATAAYRAFRVKSAESALMMVAAVIVMLGQIPFGIWIWDELPAIRSWLLEVPSTAAFRAIEIGASVGGLIMAFRMWLSIESESFGGKK